MKNFNNFTNLKNGVLKKGPSGEVKRTRSEEGSIEHPMSIHSASIEHPLGSGGNQVETSIKPCIWKYAAMILCVLMLGVGQMWGDTTLFNVDFTDETTETISTSNSGATYVSKTYDGYTMSFGVKSSKDIDITNGTGVNFKSNNYDAYQQLAIPLTGLTTQKVTVVITLHSAGTVKYAWASGNLPATPTAPSATTYSPSGTTNTLEYTPASSGSYVLYLGRSGSGNGSQYIESIVITQAEPASTYGIAREANSWTASSELLMGSGTVVSKTLSLSANTDYAFKVVNTDGNTWYGNGEVFGGTRTQSVSSTGTDNNCHLLTTEAGDYKFEFNTSTKDLTITYPKSYKYYYANTGSWTNVYVYKFTSNGSTGNNAGWPGVEIASPAYTCGGTDYYETTSDGFAKLIFTNNNGKQTSDMVVSSADAGKYTSGDNSGGGTTSWTAWPTYTISFAANGGSGSMSSISSIACGSDKTITANTFRKLGYTFAGWKANVAVTIDGVSKAAGTVIEDEAELENIGSDITLTAQWNAYDACPTSGTVYSIQTTGTISSEVSIKGNTTIDASTYSTITHGYAAFTNKNASDGKAKIATGTPPSFYFNGDDAYITMSMHCPLQTGDTIIFTRVDGSVEMCFTTTTTIDKTTYKTSSNKFVVPVALNGVNTLYAWRQSSSSLKVRNITVKRPVPIVAPSNAEITPTNGWIYVPGEEIELTASADDTDAKTTYTWYKGSDLATAKAAGAIQAAATAASGGDTYTIDECTASDANTYWCEISNGTGYETSTSYDIKIYTFFLYNNDHTANTSHTFTTIDRTNEKITVSFDLSNINYTYYFKVSDGLDTWYGKNDYTITGSTNYCDGLSSSGADVGLKSSFADEYTVDYYYESNNIVVTYPVHNQAANKVVYFDNTLTEMDNMYIRIGHDANSSASSAFTLVPGTANLYRVKTIAWSDFHAWSIADNTGWTGSNTIYQPWYDSEAKVNKPNDSYAITKQTDYQRYVVDDTISIIPTDEDNEEYGCQYYTVDKVSKMKTQTVTISSYTNGTITVNYTDTGNVARSFTSGSKTLAHTVKLTSITAIPATGYTIDDALTINGSAYSANYVVTGATTVAASFKPATYTVTLNTNSGTINAGNVTSYTYLTGATLPTNVTRDGYRFMGWYATNDFSTDRVYTIGTSEYGNKEYWAKWAQLYTITNGSPANGTITVASSAIEGETVSISAAANTGYDFSAWSIFKTGTPATTIDPASSSASTSFTMPAYGVTVNASFTAQTYDVADHTLSNVTLSSGGTTGSDVATYGTNYTATFAAATGYTLPSDVTVSIGGSTKTKGTEYTWNSSTGALTINGSYILGNIAITVTGALAADFMMVATTSGSDASLTHNESISASSKNCATLTGGSAKYLDEDKSDKQTMTVKSGESYGWNFNRNKDQIVITLSGHVLQEGSVITVSGYANASEAGFKMNGVTIYSKPTSSGSFADESYTVLSTDVALINKNELTLTRNSGSGAYLHSIIISNCASGTPCVTPVLPSLTTPNSGCTTGDFAEWDASVTNSAAISAASGDQEVTYSWTNSSSVEVGTDATFTPTSAGTYTVTVTVHSETSGYIDATATSSTLTASLYGNPSVTGPSDANYVVGASASNLSVTATPTHGESLTYQWYSNTAKSTSSPTPTALENCTTSTYKPSTAAAATTYYFCKVSGGCEDVYSSIATVAVSEAPCFTFSCESQSSSISAVSAGGSITAAMWDEATLTGGSMTNSAASQGLNVNKTYGLVFDSNNNEVTVTLSGDNVLAKDAVITLNCATVATKDAVCGFKINGNNMSPESYTATAASNETFTQSYTIPAASALIGTKSFKITRYNSNKVYLNGITVTGCDECEGISPSLSYSKTTLWVNDGDTSTPTLDKGESTGSVTYSSSNTDVATVNESTGVVTAVAGGNVTITASIAADGTHCANTATCNLTIKQATCGEVVIAGVTLSAKDAGTPEGALIASSSGYVVSTQKWEEPDGGCGTGGKLGASGNYICLTLKSGESFKNGDKVILDIATVPDVGDRKLHIYAGTSSAGTQLGVNASPVCGENEIILSGISSSTPSITLYRTDGDDKQNPYVVSMKVKRFICTDCLGFVDATENGNWNTAGNWIGSTGVSASIPTISDRVHIYKPVTVDINNARASSVYIYTNSTNTGKVTIDAGKALIIAGKLAKSSDGTNYTNTAAADVIINSTREAGTGALIIGGETGTNAATVNFETKAKNDGGWVNQFIGSPFSENKPYVDYAVQIYKFCSAKDGNRGFWNKLSEGDAMTPFIGYNILYNDPSELDVQWTGKLNESAEQTISGTNANHTDNLLANSWPAPIHIGSFQATDFTDFEQTIYIFNAGTPAQEAAGGGMGNSANAATAAGTYSVSPINSAEWISGTLQVIPAMQAFFVKASSTSASLKLNYSRLVYTPALTSVGITPTRAPRREAEDAPEVIRLHVAGENGWAANTYVLGREDFTEGYDNGWDGRYMEGESTNPQLYTPTTDGDMAVNCVPQIDGTVVGFKKGKADSQYTFTFGYEGNEEYYLKDLKLDTETRIDGEHSYTFTAEAEDNAARFIIIRKTPTIATGVEDVENGTIVVRKLIIDDKVYIIRGGMMYDVTGKMIK